MRGCFAKGCGTLVVLLVLLIGAGVYFGTRSESYTENVSANLQIVKGSAEIKKGSGTWERAADLATLFPGDSVRIADGSEVFVNYFDGSTTRLNDKSEFVLQRSSRSMDKPGLLSGLVARLTGGAPPETKVDTNITGQLVVGKALTRVEKLGSSGSSFDFQTPNSVAGVTGTVFEVVVDDQGQVTWKVAEGAVTAMAIVVDDATGQATGVLMPLAAGNQVELKALPAGITGDQAKALLSAAMETVREVVKAVREEMADAERRGAAPGAAYAAGLKTYLEKANPLILGQDQATTVVSLAKVLNKQEPSKEQAQKLWQQVTEAVVKKVVDATASITKPGEKIDLDWLSTYKSGYEILILNKGKIQEEINRVARNYNSGPFSVDFVTGAVAVRGPVAGVDLTAVIEYSYPNGDLRLKGIPSQVPASSYQSYIDNFVKSKKIITIRVEKAGARGHASSTDLSRLVTLDSHQMVVVLQNR